MPQETIVAPRTIAETRSALAAGSITATALANAFIAKIKAEDAAINSVLAVTEERALKQAAFIDSLVKNGDELPPLAGVPVGIKDVLTVKGSPATAASRILQNYHPPYDATAVRKLEEAGAVIVAKLNCDEFAMGGSNENSAYGPVKNPVALDRVPGGSSGGSAAAVAAGFCVASLGTDTGGSVRQPAAFCGVTGLLPTYGRISRYGLIAFASSLDRVGPIGNSVRDVATMLDVMAGPDVMDATADNTACDDYIAALDRPVDGMTIGVPEEYFGEGLDPEIRATVEASIDKLRKSGCKIQKISLPHTKYAVPAYYVLATAEASSNLSRFDGVRFGHRTQNPKNLSELYRASRDEGFGPEVKRRILLGTYSLSSGYYDAYYRKAQQVRTLLARDFMAAFNNVDAIITPMTPTPPWKIGEKVNDPVSMYLADIYTVGASLAGICGISVPAGKTSEGLPIGVQLLAGHFQEGKLLTVAQALEPHA